MRVRAWRWSNTLSVNAYLGHARGGTVIERIHPNGPDAWLGFIELEWRRLSPLAQRPRRRN
jgi:hypothetical protein